MVLGIIAIVFAFVPCVGWLALVPAIVGLVFGIVELVQKRNAETTKGYGIAGVVLNSVAIVVIVIWTLLFMTLLKESINEGIREFKNELNDQLNDRDFVKPKKYF